jgi:exonuclease III
MTEVLAQRAVYALIDRNARKGQKPSDHTPVFVDIDTGGDAGGLSPRR